MHYDGLWSSWDRRFRIKVFSYVAVITLRICTWGAPPIHCCGLCVPVPLPGKRRADGEGFGHPGQRPSCVPEQSEGLGWGPLRDRRIAPLTVAESVFLHVARCPQPPRLDTGVGGGRRWGRVTSTVGAGKGSAGEMERHQHRGNGGPTRKRTAPEADSTLFFGWTHPAPTALCRQQHRN